LADRAQFTRMAALGMSVNLFANHQFYWGDEHYTLTVSPDRALRMNAARTALDSGIPLAMHLDAPITPLSPFFTAWCAVNRLTRSDRVQGKHEKSPFIRRCGRSPWGPHIVFIWTGLSALSKWANAQISQFLKAIHA